MSAEFWMYLCKILIGLEICRVSLSFAFYLERKTARRKEADPEWEDEVEYAGYDE